MSVRLQRRKICEKSWAPSAQSCELNADPWELVWGQPYINAARLAAAIETDLERLSDPDFRTRLLTRDGLRALRRFWGQKPFRHWLAQSSAGKKMQTILREKLGKPGFHSIGRRLVASVHLRDLQQVLQLLGERIHKR